MNEPTSKTLLVIVTIQSEHLLQDVLYTKTAKIAEETRAEVGCRDYNCYKSLDNSSVVEVIIFDNEEAHKAHMNSPHIFAYLKENEPFNLQFAVQRVHYL